MLTLAKLFGPCFPGSRWHSTIEAACRQGWEGEAQPRIQLLGDVRGEGAQDAHEGDEHAGGLHFSLRERVGQHHHGADGSVEAELLDVFADLLDRLVDGFRELLVG